MNHEFPITHAAAIVHFRIANAHIHHFRIANAEEQGIQKIIFSISEMSTDLSQFVIGSSNWSQFAIGFCTLSFVVSFAIPISFYIIVQRNNILQDKVGEQTFVVDSSRLLSFAVGYIAVNEYRIVK